MPAIWPYKISQIWNRCRKSKFCCLILTIGNIQFTLIVLYRHPFVKCWLSTFVHFSLGLYNLQVFLIVHIKLFYILKKHKFFITFSEHQGHITIHEIVSPQPKKFVFTHSPKEWASLVVQLVKKPPAMWETCVRSLSWEDPLEKGNTTHSSILAGEFHGLYSPWGHSQTRLRDFHSRNIWVY